MYNRSRAFIQFHFITMSLNLLESFCIRWPRPEVGIGICCWLDSSGRVHCFAYGVQEWIDCFSGFGVTISLSSSTLLTSGLIFLKQETIRVISLPTVIIDPFLDVPNLGLLFFGCNFSLYSSQLNLQLQCLGSLHNFGRLQSTSFCTSQHC